MCFCSRTALSCSPRAHGTCIHHGLSIPRKSLSGDPEDDGFSLSGGDLGIFFAGELSDLLFGTDLGGDVDSSRGYPSQSTAGGLRTLVADLVGDLRGLGDWI